MKQSLSLKLGQQLKMTPQLQQAIRLLQLSALELNQEIQEALDSNPMLEVDEDGRVSESSSDTLEEATATSAENDFREKTDAVAAESTPSAEASSEMDVSEQLSEPMSEDLPVDSNWDDVYPQGAAAADSDSDFDPTSNNSEAETLTDHLLWQLNLTPMAPSDRVVALAIIDSINEDGLLGVALESLIEGVNNARLPDEELIELEDAEAILSRVQQFDPVGVAARDLQECLLLQLDQIDSITPWLPEARNLLTHHIDLLAAKDFAAMVRATKLNEADLGEVMRLLRTLQPRPGAELNNNEAEYVIPDVVVRKDSDRWLVELNPETLPKVRINDTYAGWINKVRKSDEKDFMRDNLQEARWFLKSLQTRHDTLLKVASKIVEVQREFLDHGPEAMKPLILADIANQVDLHESTISRVTNRKYLATPRGLFELKYFFSSHVGTATGGEVSSTAIRAIIKKLTSDENPRRPLSDSKIAAILKDQNISVARRTVAKYRESLSIPPSNERKQLI